MDDSGAVQWRRDGSTSRTIRVLWSLGVGTFFATISIVVFWRLYDLTGQVGGRSIVVAAAAALVVTVLGLAVAGGTGRQIERLSRRLPVSTPSERGARRAADAVLGTVAMVVVVGSLMIAGRFASEHELIAAGAGPFTLLAALSIPLALVALLTASFLSSVGAIDREEGALHLYEPEEHVDLAHVEAISTRRFGDGVLVTLEYDQPDGRYVPGPRRLVVPPEVAWELEGVVDAQR